MNKLYILSIVFLFVIVKSCTMERGKSINGLDNISIGSLDSIVIKEIKKYKEEGIIDLVHKVSINGIRCRIDFHYCDVNKKPYNTLEAISLTPKDSTEIDNVLKAIIEQQMSTDLKVEKRSIQTIRTLFVDFETRIMIRSKRVIIDDNQIILCEG